MQILKAALDGCTCVSGKIWDLRAFLSPTSDHVCFALLCELLPPTPYSGLRNVFLPSAHTYSNLEQASQDRMPFFPPSITQIDLFVFTPGWNLWTWQAQPLAMVGAQLASVEGSPE